MPNTFLISDTHFGHANICRFTRSDGSKLRPWDSPEEMDEEMIDNWNSVVSPKDKVYHLGDVVINRKHLKTIGRLNGEKILVKGNHDIFRMMEYAEYFKDIRGYHVMDNLIFSHIPIHAESKGRFRGNVHGHTHANNVMKRTWYGRKINDPWYFCVCAEQTNYFPIPYDDVKSYFS